LQVCIPHISSLWPVPKFASNYGYIYEADISLPGRGILVDYARWAAMQSPPIYYSTFSTHAISFPTLLAVLKYQDVTPKKGDVLFVRTAVIPEWESFSEERKKEYAMQKVPEHAGMEACTELLEWLWDTGISAVAGDAISWEVSTRIAISISVYESRHDETT
jgi:hypothetical protein